MNKAKVNLGVIRQILLLILVAIITGSVGYKLGSKQLAAGLIPGSARSQVSGVTNRDGVDFGLFWQVWDRLEANYVDTKAIDPQKMVYGAIEGMTSALDDPYTSFLPPQQNTATKEDLAGQFAGVGIQLGYVNKTLAVMAALPDLPAAKAGIKNQDLILHIKDTKKGLDKDTTGMSLPDAVAAIRGEKGSQVTLKIYHQGDKQEKEITLTRDVITVPSVSMYFVNDKGDKDDNGQFAHLIVTRFGERTADEWDSDVQKILDHKPKTKGVILDLRDNPGGYLQRAIDLASEFISDGIVVQEQGRTKTDTFSVDKRGKLIGMPLNVLINGGSASASEILAGALRDDLHVKLVGEKSFGKGTVQEAQELPGGAGLHVTIAKWLLPDGENIHKVGLTPDIEVKLPDAPDASGNLKDTQLIRAIQELNK